MAAPRFNNVLKLLLKIAITAVCIWYVSRKINWSVSLQTVARSNAGWLLLAVLLFVASKLVSAIRLNTYFHNIQLRLPQKLNMQLYWLGMYYNLFLPGGIGGDAYKVILLSKHYQQPAKQLTAAVLLDRISGVVGLGILAAIYYYAIYQGQYYSTWLPILVVPGVAAYYLFVKWLFPSFIKGFWPTLWMGIAVQALQVLCAYAIMQALHLDAHYTAYIFIFLLSSIVAILPFTIGGLGARELVFVWGSKQFLLNQSESVCISILFYLITVVVSLVGLTWVYRNPLKQTAEK
ncbi:lysylphosphatidylglycerol synthase transmembrane domain-containing protein [Deminuibacter soli]|uniref:UPF0104 family protein n=1 Tax=Deminuibacter soli TaxID=2291815 RepID=A0A3E1NNN1_9BACT|nr:lysylphosphatidylglycerol synthase transmembrane domain-containing protein [Deminuibacter soli]RFM29434.1 UPF0104 family protein [Deminuibacter soli]